MSMFDACSYYTIDCFDKDGKFLVRVDYAGPTDLQSCNDKLKAHAEHWYGEWYLDFLKRYNYPNKLPSDAKFGIVTCLKNRVMVFFP